MSDTTAQDCNCCGMERYCINGLCELCSDYNHKLQAQRDALLEACKRNAELADAAILAMPTGEYRTKLTEINLLRLQAIKLAEKETK